MRLKNFFKTTGMFVVALSMFVVPVMAERKSYSFELYTDYSDNMYDYSAGNPKDDAEQAAYIYTQGGNITASDDFTMTVFGMDHSPQYSQEFDVTSNNARYVTYYNRGYTAPAKTQLCIRAKTYKYDVEVNGYWFS